MHLHDTLADVAPLDASALLAAHLSTVNHALRHVARRRRLSPDQRDELASDTYLHLLRNDGATLKSYQGRSSLLTFLVRVIERVLLDSRIARSGKWRPSARARRLGRSAVLLERAVHRDGLTLSEATAVLAPQLGNAFTEQELEFLHSLLPNRAPRRTFHRGALDFVPSEAMNPEQLLLQAGAIRQPLPLADMLARLPADERRIIALRFRQGVRLTDIARQFGIEPKALYRRYARAVARLRSMSMPSPPGRNVVQGLRPSSGRAVDRET